MFKKIWRKYPIIILLLFFVGCKDNNNPTQTDPEDPEPVPVEPVAEAQPDVLFTEADLIEDGEESTVIIDRLIELIDAVPADASIYISIYLFEYEPLLEALERAETRNVSLYVMMDMSDRSNNTNTADRLRALGENVKIVSVRNNASASAINHNKFVLLPEVETEEGMAENLIFQTSQNFTESGHGKIQDGTILSDKDLYEAYLDYWEDMDELSDNQMASFSYREFEDDETGTTAYFYPKRKDNQPYGEDTIIEILDDIDDPSSATVKIAMSAWTDSRMVIVDKLSELLSQGADLQVVTKSSIGEETYDELRQLSDDGATVKIYNMGNSGEPKINMHSKFMMVDGVWDGEDTNLLFTGTQNFTMNALRNNNEVSLLFRDHEFYSRYKDYFDELKSLPGVCCNTQKAKNF